MIRAGPARAAKLRTAPSRRRTGRRVALPPRAEDAAVGLLVGDGFKFGCGFTLAAVLAALAVVGLLAVSMLLAPMVGLDLSPLLRR